MNFISTRGLAPAVSLSEAITSSIASDGGLYIPERFPQVSASSFEGLFSWKDIGKRLLEPFFERDYLEPYLDEICESAFDFPIPLKKIADKVSVLELFHGPTAAFKDVGAKFLAECLSHLPGKRTILVATSGDTGGAVASAFHGITGIEVIVLFPKGRVSPRQQSQLTSWGQNVNAFAIEGDFDDCQRIAKAAFADKSMNTELNLLSANSINLGRLLPQIVYYAAASLWYLRQNGVAPGFIIPTGNLGNATACFWAREIGFPVREIVMTTNANHAVPDFFSAGEWLPHPTIETLANAMDVGNPSNIERIRSLFPDIVDLRKIARSFSVSDEEISQTIADGPEDWNQDWCPHTATAVFVWQKLRTSDWIIVATAHPAKFESVVEPLANHQIEVPEQLAGLLGKPEYFESLAPSLEALKIALGIE